MAWRKASPETERKRLDEETARSVSLLKRMGGFRPYKLDALADKKGIAVYQEMFRDERVWAGLRRVVAPIAALSWSIEPYADSDAKEPAEADVEAAHFCEFCLRNLKGHFSKDVWDLLDALPCGVSITEINYQYIERGRFAGKLGLKSLKAKNPDSIGIQTDAYYNVTGLTNNVGDVGRDEQLDPEKFIIFSPLARYEEPAGWSLFRSAYRWFWLKDSVTKLRAVFTERFAQGTVVGKYNAANPETKTAMEKLVKAYKGETGITIPSDAELEIIEQATKGETEFARFVRDCNESILIAIVGSTLDTQEGDKTGALRATETHRDTANISVELYARWLADVLTEQLLDRLTKLNYASANTPVFQFALRKPRDLSSSSQALDVLVNKVGMQIPVAWAREQLGIPKPGEDEEVLAGARAPAAPSFGPPDEFDQFVEVTADYVRIPVASGEPTATITVSAKEGIKALYDGERKIIVTYLFARAKGWTLAKAKAWVKQHRASKQEEGHADAWRGFRETQADLQHVRLNRIQETLDGLQKHAGVEGDEAFGKLFESLTKPIRDILKKGDYEAIGGLRPDSEQLVPLMAKLFLTAHLAGKMHAVEEMRRAWKAKAPKAARFPTFGKFEEVEKFADPENTEELLTIAEAGKKFSGKVPMTRALFQTLTKKARGEAVYVAGLTADEVAKDIKPLIKKAIDEGMSSEQFKDVLADKATEFTGKTWLRRKHPGAYKLAKTPYHAENVFRTNIMGAYNEGRRAAFEDPALADEFPAWQYVAILDDRTREEHAAQDGKIYAKDDPYWDEWYPPNGYQCRCFVTAVSRWEFDDSMLSKPTAATADAGFGKLTGEAKAPIYKHAQRPDIEFKRSEENMENVEKMGDTLQDLKEVDLNSPGVWEDNIDTIRERGFDRLANGLKAWTREGGEISGVGFDRFSDYARHLNSGQKTLYRGMGVATKDQFAAFKGIKKGAHYQFDQIRSTTKDPEMAWHHATRREQSKYAIMLEIQDAKGIMGWDISNLSRWYNEAEIVISDRVQYEVIKSKMRPSKAGTIPILDIVLRRAG